MVDFNNDSTITTAPQDIVKIMILERRKYVIDAFEHYYKQKGLSQTPNKAIVHSRLFALFLEFRPTLKRVMTLEDFGRLQSLILNNKDIETWGQAFEIIDHWLDDKRLIRVDTIKRYDSTNVEIENKERGL